MGQAASAAQLLCNGIEGRAEVIGTFAMVESDVFIRFNLRRQV